jgi:hypothetical protein
VTHFEAFYAMYLCAFVLVFMYVCIRVYMYLYIYLYVLVYMYFIRIRINNQVDTARIEEVKSLWRILKRFTLCIYMYLYTYLYVFVYVFICVCMYVCMCVCMYVCYIPVSIIAYQYIHIHIHIHIPTIRSLLLARRRLKLFEGHTFSSKESRIHTHQPKTRWEFCQLFLKSRWVIIKNWHVGYY